MLSRTAAATWCLNLSFRRGFYCRRVFRIATHANPLNNLKHRRKNLAVALMRVVVFLQAHHGYGFTLILLDLLSNSNSKRLNAAFATDGRGGSALPYPYLHR